MKAINKDGYISIVVNHDEALVLLEWLHNFNIEERQLLFQDQAEKRILFDLEAELEKVISDTLKGNYHNILLKARQKLRDDE